MADPVRVLLTNAATAGLVALAAWAASRVLRRHAVVHALWLLALLKLVTPPIAPLPLLPSWTRAPLLLAPGTPTVAVIPAPLGTDALLRERAAMPEHATASRPGSNGTARVSTEPIPRAAAPTPLPSAPAQPPVDWRSAVGMVLVSGALAILGLAAWRFSRFRQLLACARPGPENVVRRASTLASRLELRRVPRLLLLPARIPPMLWPGRSGPLLLMPEGLLGNLSTDELDALLAHELAHVRRRDHWVRLVEVAATALFWWYPVTWWARRALRRAEERCCDEWVLRLLPRSARAYADGLLKSLTFVADTPVPALASGLGPVEDLQARLKEILMTRPSPQLAVPLRLGLAAAAALGLAVFPTHAQPRASDDPAKAAPVAREASQSKPAPAAAEAPAAPEAVAPEAVENGVEGGIAPGVSGGVAGGVAGGVPGGVRGGVPGGVAGGVPGAITVGVPAAPLSPRPALAPFPPRALLGTPLPPAAVAPLLSPMALPRPPLAPPPGRVAMHSLAPMALLAPLPPAAALAGPAGPRSPEQRALDEERRSIDDQQRQLRQREIALQKKQLDVEAQAEQAELKAEAERLRAEGEADQAARVEKKAQLSTRRTGLQQRELELEAEDAALEAKLEAEMRADQERLEAAEKDGQEKAMEDAQREMERAEAAQEQARQDLEKKQEALQHEAEDSEKEEEALEAEEQVQALRGTTEELAQSMREQIDSLKEARDRAPAHRAELDREIQRLQSALDALNAGRTPKPPAARTPMPPKAPPAPSKAPRP